MDVSGTDMVQQGLGQEEEKESMEKEEGSRVEEAKTEIHETVTDGPQDSSGVQEAKIEIDNRSDIVKTGDQQKQEGKRSHMDDLSSIISAMLIPKYTPGERSVF